MEWLTTILISANAKWILLFLTAVIVFLAFALKNKWFSFKGKGLIVGMSEEKSLMMNLWEYINSQCDAFTSELPKDKGIDRDKAKYVFSKCEDIFQRALFVNNMTTDDYYVKTKQTLVYNCILKRSDNQYFRTPEFKEKIDKFTSNLIKELIDMKSKNE